MSLFGSLRIVGSVPGKGHLPGFDGATGWLNSPPLAAEDLQGKLVFADFRTYTRRLNWLRTLAHVGASTRARPRPLVGTAWIRAIAIAARKERLQ